MFIALPDLLPTAQQRTKKKDQNKKNSEPPLQRPAASRFERGRQTEREKETDRKGQEKETKRETDKGREWDKKERETERD